MRWLLLFLTSATAFAQPPHPLFASDQVHEIRLTFAQPDWWERLRANFEGKDDPDWLEGSFEWRDVRYEKIAVRFKGNSSYRSYPGRKKSFKLDFNNFVKGQKLLGLEQLNLNNAFKDPSFVREKMYYELAAAAGLAAPRVSYAALYINNSYWGLYFLTEEVDKDFLQGRFGETEDGNLFKGDPAGTLQWRGPQAAGYQNAYELETNNKANDWRDLIGLIDVLNNTPAAELPERLEKRLDVKAALTWIALDNLTCNLDSYLGSGHNYYLYHRQSDDRFTPIPWDPNEAWGNFGMNLTLNQLLTLPVNFTGAGPMMLPPGVSPPPAGSQRPLAGKLIPHAAYRELYLEIYRRVAELAAPDLTTARMNLLRDLIRRYVLDDPLKMFSNEQFENAMSEDLRLGGGGPAPPPNAPPPMIVPGLEKFLRQRSEFVGRAIQP